ncbi:hypothetical protein hairong_021 [Pseudomonas phage hairong]|nr:hypothetical protein hairong_021 [Pseudomonas phage hairong]
MPARRFWMMERQIDRIRAENEIRLISLNTLTSPPETKEQLQNIEAHIGRLTLEIGEKLKVRRNVIVAPEPGAAAKFLKLTGQG